MTRLLILLVLAGCASTDPVCRMDTEATFNRLKQSAGVIAPVSFDYVQSASLHFRGGMFRRDWGGKVIPINGHAVYATADVYIDPELCGSKSNRDWVLAHEVGHLMSFKTRADFDHATDDGKEAWANEYARALLAH